MVEGSLRKPRMAHEDDDRERTAALLASVRASIQAERAAREEATAEPPAGLAELLRPPGTPRRRRAQLQREWDCLLYTSPSPRD